MVSLHSQQQDEASTKGKTLLEQATPNDPLLRGSGSTNDTNVVII